MQFISSDFVCYCSFPDHANEVPISMGDNEAPTERIKNRSGLQEIDAKPACCKLFRQKQSCRRSTYNAHSSSGRCHRSLNENTQYLGPRFSQVPRKEIQNDTAISLTSSQNE